MATQILNFFQTSIKVLYTTSLVAFALALLIFPIWYQIFTEHNLLVQIRMAAPGSEYVKVYWDNPEYHPNDYARINIKPVLSQFWKVTIEAIGEKNSQSKGSEVWLLDISTHENRVDWSKAVMGSDKWELRDDSSGSQGKIAIAYTGKLQILAIPIEGSELTIKLLRHAYSGKVRVIVNDKVSEIDLFDSNGGIETLTFPSIVKGDEIFRNYEINAVDTPWHRLKFVSEGEGQVKIEKVTLQNQIITPNKDGEFFLPFRFWNRFSCAILSTIISFFWMTVLFVSTVNLWQKQPNKRFGIWIYIVGLSVTLGGFWMLVFYPALMSPDSLDQWSQALKGQYTDWHPIGMTILMRVVVIIFPDLLSSQQVAIFAFFQGSLFWMSIFYAINTFLQSSRLKIVVLLSFFLYYPLWAYTSTLWKDVWIAIWFLLYICEVYKLILDRKDFKLRLLTSSICCAMTIFTRHNAIISVILFILSSILLLNIFNLINFKKTTSILISFLVGIFLYKLIYFPFTDSVANIKGNDLNFYLSYDLVGTLYFSEENVDQMRELATYQKFGRDKLAKAISLYRCGGGMSDFVFGKSPPLGVKDLIDSNTVLTDMFLILPKYSIPFIKHKICAISSLLQVTGINYPYQPPIVQTELDEFGRNYDIRLLKLANKSRLPELNTKIFKFLAEASSTKNWFTIFYKHSTILALSIMFCITSIFGLRRVDNFTLFPAIFLLIAGTAYFLPYLLTVPVADWRYLLFSNITWMLSFLASISSFYQILHNNKIIRGLRNG